MPEKIPNSASFRPKPSLSELGAVAKLLPPPGANGEPLAMAGRGACRKSPQGLPGSFTMLTINAHGHGLKRQFHKPVDEKCRVGCLPPDGCSAWRTARAQDGLDWLRQYPADRQQAMAVFSAQLSLVG